MSLSLQSIKLEGWRNFLNKEVEFSPALTILTGKNASGKTNTIEAIQLLLSGHTFRHSKTEEFINDASPSTIASLFLTGDQREIVRSCRIKEKKRYFYQNKKNIKQASLSEELLPIIFIPDDLRLVKQSASFRREELDLFGSLAHGGYRKLLSLYKEALFQRNTYLKQAFLEETQLRLWDEELSYIGANLLTHRLSLFHQLSQYTARIYKKVVSRETLCLHYLPSWTEQDVLSMNKKEIQKEILNTLSMTREQDIRLKQTTHGPHRDDFSYILENKDARTFASQGQQRSIVLAWKLGQVSFTQDILQKVPVLLLDDVMSELDEARREAVSKYIKAGVQTIITTTHLDYFQKSFLKQAKVVEYE